MAVKTTESKLNQHIEHLCKVYFDQHLTAAIKTADSPLNEHIEAIYAIAVDSLVKENAEIKA